MPALSFIHFQVIVSNVMSDMLYKHFRVVTSLILHSAVPIQTIFISCQTDVLPVFSFKLDLFSTFLAGSFGSFINVISFEHLFLYLLFLTLKCDPKVSHRNPLFHLYNDFTLLHNSSNMFQNYPTQYFSGNQSDIQSPVLMSIHTSLL